MRLADSEAAAFISRNKADVVVFDVGMPYQPNWDFAEVLRLLPGVTGIPFVFTSANTTELDKLVGPTGAYLLTGTPTNLSGLMALIDSTVGR
jgi:CheY-like chemotaxis protein